MAKPKIRRSAKMDEIDPPESSSFLAALTRFWVASLLILLILYGAALALSRTAGFRDFLSQRIERNLGLSVSIESTVMSPGGRLVLSGITLRGDGKNQVRGTMNLSELALDFSLRRGVSRKGWISEIELAGGDLGFERNPQGGWFPAALSPLASQLDQWLELGLTPPAPEAMPPVVDGVTDAAPAPAGQVFVLGAKTPRRLAVRSGSLAWREVDGTALVTITGVDVDVEASELLDRPVFAVDLWVARAMRGNDLLADRVHITTLHAGGQVLPLTMDGEFRLTPPSLKRHTDHQRARELMDKYAPGP